MTKFEKENWLCNIQNSAEAISKQIGYDTVEFILQKYGANSIKDLSPCYYSEVFSELFAIEADLKN